MGEVEGEHVAEGAGGELSRLEEDGAALYRPSGDGSAAVLGAPADAGTADRKCRLPWVLLVLSWIGFTLFLTLLCTGVDIPLPAG